MPFKVLNLEYWGNTENQRKLRFPINPTYGLIKQRINKTLGVRDPYNQLRVAIRSNLPQELLKSIEYEPKNSLLTFE